MKLYIIHYNNGRSYDDNKSWYDEVCFTSKDRCIKKLENEGFVKTNSKIYWEYKTTKDMSDIEYYHFNVPKYADIEIINLVS